ncbi:hypothetical protein B0H10DRAFT_1241986 [Mycena sp. CBHHK59/15]|nr:hypothetical protein B0H10DRAFT_1241986 [Mycena sp. CBHHK59/15]
MGPSVFFTASMAGHCTTPKSTVPQVPAPQRRKNRPLLFPPSFSAATASTVSPSLMHSLKPTMPLIFLTTTPTVASVVARTPVQQSTAWQSVWGSKCLLITRTATTLSSGSPLPKAGLFRSNRSPLRPSLSALRPSWESQGKRSGTMHGSPPRSSLFFCVFSRTMSNAFRVLGIRDHFLKNSR